MTTTEVRSGKRGIDPIEDETGIGLIRAVLTLLLVVVVVYAGLKFIPVKAASFQFEDAVRDQVMLAGSSRRRMTEQQIRTTLLDRAKDLGLPVDGRNIVVRRGRGMVRIEVDYVVPVELIRDYVYNWRFHLRYEGPTF